MNSPNVTTPTISAEAKRLAFNRVVYERLAPLSLGMLIIFAVFTVVNVISLPQHAILQTAVHDVVLIVLFFVLWIFTRRRSMPLNFANPIAGVMSLIVLSDVLHTFYLISTEIYAIHVIITIVVTSVVVLSYVWFLIVTVAGTGAWAIIAWFSMDQEKFIIYQISIISVGLVGIFILVARRMSNLRILSLRMKAEHQQQELIKNLENTEREIEDRKRAEAEKEKLEGQLIQAQKMEAVGRLAGGVAHDMNNMLSVIKGSAEVMLLDMEPQSAEWSDLDTILAACKRGQELTQNLLGFARQGKYRRERIRINELVTDVLVFLKRTMPSKVRLDTNLDTALSEVEGDPGQMNQVFVNLLINAIEAVSDEGTIRIQTENSTLEVSKKIDAVEMPAGDYVEICVSDDGVGMDEETVLKAFEPFYTRKVPGEGTGLGLSMVYGTIKNHNGYVFIESHLGQGTEITIFLPVYRGTSMPPGPTTTSEVDVLSDSGTILLVDDEPLVRRSGKRILQRMGYDVIEAENGKIAVDLYREHQDKILAVVLDLLMPVMDGQEAFRVLHRINPDIKVVFVSGYSKDRIARELLANHSVHFIQKPLSINDISESLQRITKV